MKDVINPKDCMIQKEIVPSSHPTDIVICNEFQMEADSFNLIINKAKEGPLNVAINLHALR